MFAIGVFCAAVTTCAALFVPWLPLDASRQDGRIDFTFWFATVIAIVVFSFVATMLIYAFVHFRVDEHDFSEDGPPIHGNTKLEVFWTTIPFLLVTALSIVSAIVLSDNAKAGSDPLKITVIGQQFAWTFKYPNGQIYPTLHVPIDRPILFTITSKDVIHSFWVPQWGQKEDAVPGITTTLVVTPDKLGRFPVICVELCGLGHALMRSYAYVMPQTTYATWYSGGTAPSTAQATGGATGAVAAFNSNNCAVCHTFSAIPGAVGKVGPSLDNLSAVAAALHEPLATFIQQAIVSPYTHLPAGYTAGTMPSNFGTTIPKAQLTALVNYLAAHTH
jgi:cytochrome c oxidase subunit 2